VLDGDFVKKIQNKYGHQSGRLSEEDFASLMARDFFEVRESSLRDQYIAAKSALSGTISFDSCNRWLEIGRRLAEACITRPQKQEVACRVLYKVLGYLCVGVDYLLKDLAFIEIKDRRVALLDGFSFGKGGRAGLDSILDAADGLLRQYVTNGEQIARTLRSSVTEDAMKIPANILSEYFSRPEIGKELFSTARAFDDYSVEVRFSPFGRLGTSAQSFLGVCLDYWQIERRRFLESFVP
jgi:hypothetical protein